MKRREFITLLGGAAATWPLQARAQPLPVVGYLSSGSPAERSQLVTAFRSGLSESGRIDGQNVRIEYRWAYSDDATLLELATDLVRRQVAVIATLGGTAPTLAAKAATSKIPIVFGMGGDPVKLGLVASLARPGGNVTGVNFMSGDLDTKRFGLLHELLPTASRFAVLVNPRAATVDAQISDAQAAASAVGRRVEVLNARGHEDIDAAFSSIMTRRVQALLVSSDSLFLSSRVQVVTLAARQAIPAIYAFREFPEGGGLMSYGASLTDQARRTGTYVGRILSGEKPSDLPILRATNFHLVINLKTAKALGIEVPPTLLARADEVIE